MNKNTLYAVIAVLVVAVVGFGIYTYRQESQPEGVQIQLDENGLSVEKE